MNILICDDNETCIEECKRQLFVLAKKYKIDINIESAISGEEVMMFLDSKFNKVDLIYLDINMPNMNGMELAIKLRENNVVADIVFYTVDDSYAIDGYEVEAMNYIVKGISDDKKFERIFVKAADRTRKRRVEIISLSCAGEHRNIAIQDILYFEVQKRIVTVHYHEENVEKEFEFYSTLSKIEEFLYGKGFVRIHSSYLVQEIFIKKKTVQQVDLVNGMSLPVGKSYRANLK